MKNFSIKKDRILDSLVGPVAIVRTQTFEVDGGVKTQTDEREARYNIGGYKTMLIRYDEFLEVKIKQVIEFNDNEEKIGYTNYGRFDEEKSSGKYKRNKLGLIVAKYHNNDCEEEYTYDMFRNIEKVYYPSTGAYTLYTYDDSDFVIQQLDVNEDSPFGSLFGPSRRVAIFINDEVGNVTEVKFYNAETGAPISAQRSIYDVYGNEIRLIIYECDGSIKSYTDYKYSYDEQKNWISKQTLSEKGNVYREVKRIITHY